MKAGGFQLPAGIKKALAPAIAAISIAAPAFAEGTGEGDYLSISPLLLSGLCLWPTFEGEIQTETGWMILALSSCHTKRT